MIAFHKIDWSYLTSHWPIAVIICDTSPRLPISMPISKHDENKVELTAKDKVKDNFKKKPTMKNFSEFSFSFVVNFFVSQLCNHDGYQCGQLFNSDLMRKYLIHN